MQTMTHAAPLEVLMRFGTDPQLAQRASAWAQPIVAASAMPRFTSDEDGQAPKPMPFSIPNMIVELSKAICAPVRDVVLMPDDGKIAIIQAKIMKGELAPKKRIGIVLDEIHGRRVQTLSVGVRTQIRSSLNRIFQSRGAGEVSGFEYAMGAAKTDILFHFLCVATMGDESRTKRLAGLVRCLHAAIPLAVVDVQKGIWLMHRA